MRVLLVDIPASLRDSLRQILARHHDVVTLDGDVRDLEACAGADACDVIVHGLPEDSDSLTLLDHASRGVWNLLTTTRAKRYVLLSSMRIFDAYGDGWHITEGWSPRPTTDPTRLAPYLAEIASREISRARAIECLALRLDEVVSHERFDNGPVEPDWLDVEDAIAAIVRAVTIESASSDGARWVPLHIVRGGPGSTYPSGKAANEPFAFTAHHQAGEQAQPASRTPVFPESPAPLSGLPDPERIVMFGAGGPLGAVTTTFLKDNHRLLLTGRRPMRDVAASPPQSEGAPLPETPSAPHEERVVDVTDQDAVLAAAQGMDAIINCTVLRHDPVEAFRVNTLGAFNIMHAAVTAGIRRVVQTGPVLTLAPHPAGYIEDRDVGSDAPPRPGDNLYFISKFLGQEICRIFAEQHGIACLNLLFSGFVDPGTAENRDHVPGSFIISWDDSGRAMAAAVRVRNLPAPFSVIHVLVDAPHDRYRNDAARRILDWEPQDRLDHLWHRRA
jgi:nucleoside-diphosphate-sugar epimerase